LDKVRSYSGPIREFDVTVREQPTASMLIDRRLACGLCVALALAVITIFILPSTQGPYSVVRGPATVFQAARAAPCARCSGARAIVPRFRLSNFAFLVMSSITVANTESTLGARERDTVLRC